MYKIYNLMIIFSFIALNIIGQNKWLLNLSIENKKINPYDYFVYKCSLENTGDTTQKMFDKEFHLSPELEYSIDGNTWQYLCCTDYSNLMSMTHGVWNPQKIQKGNKVNSTRLAYIPTLGGKPALFAFKNENDYFIRAKCLPDSIRNYVYSEPVSVTTSLAFDYELDKIIFNWLDKQQEPYFIHMPSYNEFSINKENLQYYKTKAYELLDFYANIKGYEKSKYYLWARIIVAKCEIFEAKKLKNDKLNMKIKLNKALDIFFQVRGTYVENKERSSININDFKEYSEAKNIISNSNLFIVRANQVLLRDIVFYNKKFRLNL